MAPIITVTRRYKEPKDNLDPYPKLKAPQASTRKYEILYLHWLIFGYLHAAALYGAYLAYTTAKWKTIIFFYLISAAATIGVTAGAHRLWTHRAYKAKMPLEIVLMVFYSMAYQNTLIYWVRDHRMHHRYSDTDADPHNASRGIFFAHIGWLLVRVHPEVKKRAKFIDMSDIYANPVLTFQKKYAIPFLSTMTFVLPTLIPMYFFGETFNTAWNLNMLRFMISIHRILLINSVAHLWGFKPYDKNIKPAQNLAVSALTLGEGFHNYHHAFPWDYRSAELGNNWLNFTTKFIDVCAWFGLAYDLKSVPSDVAQSRARRIGDGSNIWGFKSD